MGPKGCHVPVTPLKDGTDQADSGTSRVSFRVSSGLVAVLLLLLRAADVIFLVVVLAGCVGGESSAT